MNNRVIKPKSSMKKAIKSGELKIGTLTLKTHVLEDGTRIIEQQSVIDFLEWLGSDVDMNSPEIKQQVEDLAKFTKGVQ